MDDITKEMLSYMNAHNMTANDDYTNYHLSMAYYYIYYTEVNRMAECIETGEIFDEREVCAVLKNLNIAKQTFLYFKAKLQVCVPEFDTDEKIEMDGCKLEHGFLVGDKKRAMILANKWMEQFKNITEIKYREGLGVNDNIAQGFFLYEVATFFYYLTGEELIYEFMK